MAFSRPSARAEQTAERIAGILRDDTGHSQEADQVGREYPPLITNTRRLRTFVLEEATIITHEMNKTFYDKVMTYSHTLSPDGPPTSKASFETMSEKIRSAPTASCQPAEFNLGNQHNDAIVFAWLGNQMRQGVDNEAQWAHQSRRGCAARRWSCESTSAQSTCVDRGSRIGAAVRGRSRVAETSQ
jgi:hypothetical protein